MGSEVAVIVVSSTLTSLATVCVGLRSLSRFSVSRNPSLDDYFILIAIGLSWIHTGLLIRRMSSELML